MKEKIGEVFSIAVDNPPVLRCTVSKKVYGGENCITYSSLDKNTDISAEVYPYHKLLIVIDGVVEIYESDGFCKQLKADESILTMTGVPMGIRTSDVAVYTEIAIRR